LPKLNHQLRKGTTLVELVVAFSLAALLAALGGAALVATERHVRNAVADSGDRRTLREAQSVLATELRTAAAEEITLRGDTAADFLGVVGLSVVCVSSGTQLVLPGSISNSSLAFTTWRSTVTAGDLIAAFDTSPPAAWRKARIDSVTSRTDGAGCSSATGFRSPADSAAHRAVTRLDRVFDVGIGAPVRILRAGRFVLHLGSDKSWSLAYRPCDPIAVCGTAQPLVGPLAPARDSGLSIAVNGPDPILTVSVRAPPSPPATGTTQRALIALRNHAISP
jgi:type II secretory pathway pseudopilin PulG